MLLKSGGDYGWPECYYDPFAEETGACAGIRRRRRQDGGRMREQDSLRSQHFPAHWAPNGMVRYDKKQFPARYRDGVFIAFHGSWDRAPYPQGGYNVVFQPLAGDRASGNCEIFADGFAGAVKTPEGAAHRPSGLAVGPDGALYVSDDVRGTNLPDCLSGRRCGRRGGHSVSECDGSGRRCRRAPAKPPEGTHPDAGSQRASPFLRERRRRWWRWAIASTTVKWAERLVPGCHGANGTGSPLGPDLTGEQMVVERRQLAPES